MCVCAIHFNLFGCSHFLIFWNDCLHVLMCIVCCEDNARKQKLLLAGVHDFSVHDFNLVFTAQVGLSLLEVGFQVVYVGFNYSSLVFIYLSCFVSVRCCSVVFIVLVWFSVL